MSGLWLTPAAPGTVAPTHLDKVRELHATVRDWIERSAVAQRNDHLRANHPYVDLMFAFGFATLGDHATANTLVEEARKVMVVPIPEGGSAQADQAVTAAVVRSFLFRALSYRIDEALAGKCHEGPLAADVRAVWGTIRATGRQGTVNNPYKLARYVIDRFREQYWLVEPEEQPDPYLDWTQHGDTLKRGLATLGDVYDASEFVRIAEGMLRDAASHKNPTEGRLRVLADLLPLAGRGGERYAMELLRAALEVFVAPPTSEKPATDLLVRTDELLQRALRLAVRFRCPEAVTSMAVAFTRWVIRQPDQTQFALFRRSGRAVLGALQAFDLREAADQALTEWRTGVFAGVSLDELFAPFGPKRNDWGLVLSGLQVLAGGWLSHGANALAEPILSAVRQELLNPAPGRMQPHDSIELVRAHVAALGYLPFEVGFRSLAELFRELSPLAITNTWRTAEYYSRFHLLIVEDAVFAVCRLCLANPAPVPASP